MGERLAGAGEFQDDTRLRGDRRLLQAGQRTDGGETVLDEAGVVGDQTVPVGLVAVDSSAQRGQPVGVVQQPVDTAGQLGVGRLRVRTAGVDAVPEGDRGGVCGPLPFPQRLLTSGIGGREGAGRGAALFLYGGDEVPDRGDEGGVDVLEPLEVGDIPRGGDGGECPEGDQGHHGNHEQRDDLRAHRAGHQANAVIRGEFPGLGDRGQRMPGAVVPGRLGLPCGPGSVRGLSCVHEFLNRSDEVRSSVLGQRIDGGGCGTLAGGRGQCDKGRCEEEK